MSTSDIGAWANGAGRWAPHGSQRTQAHAGLTGSGDWGAVGTSARPRCRAPCLPDVFAGVYEVAFQARIVAGIANAMPAASM